jgi:NAD(P)-dependent dehydrogenase (short-subunit alcohol dehydrogenase family)
MSKVAIVTGSSSGIGAATAVELSRRGWSVVINYSKDKKRAEDAKNSCKDAIVVQADVGEDADCRKLAKAALDKWGRIDALVNNAGATKFVPHAKLEELSAEDFQRIYRVNVVAAFQMTRACAPALKASKGAVVNVSSLAAFLGTGSSIAYAASKAALVTMTHSLARVLGPEIRVNAVQPGFVDTPWMHSGYGEARFKEMFDRYSSNAPLKSACKPEDIADAIAWLVEGARQVTGESILVDSGFHLASPR